MKRSHVTALALLGVSLSAAAPSAAQDLAVTAGANAKVILDNAKVRVIELKMAPGTSTGMHSHGDNLVVFLSGGTAMQTMADGTSRSMERRPGDVLWSEAVTHDTKNTGKAAVRTLIIELKAPPAP